MGMKRFLLFLTLFSVLSLTAQNPWTGGLNACQFGRMDLDNDGRKDLLVFDRHGNRLLCFLNQGGVGEIDFQYTTIYDDAFPNLNDWAVFVDYDGDGLDDIFTYSKGWAGIKVYRNVSTLGHLGFQLVVYPYLTSYQGGGEVNLLATDADYPAIFDLDGDGDLDILTFGVMGNFLEKHVNQSVERYACRDSLVFERTELCWGRVAESEEDNVMYLDTCLFGYGMKADRDDFRHRGATVTVKDLTGNGLLDLLLADVDYPGLSLLINGGDEDKALMVSQMDFPPSVPVQLASMPVPFFTDINNDGVDDLLVSPFDPNPMACEGKESVWLYLNQGSNEHPDFHLYTKSFLQEAMIDVGKGAYPMFADLDGDGLLDLSIRDFWGQTTVFRNVGTAQHPAFVLIESVSNGKSGWSASCYFDVDQDGLVDLVEGNVSGKLSYYKGDGVGFEWMTDFWGGVDVRDYQSSYYGYSVPTLFYYHDRLLLCVGSEQGKLFLYEVSSAPVFEEVSGLWDEICDQLPVSFGIHAAAALADLDGDGRLEVVVGNFSGGLQLFNAEIPVNLELSEIQEDNSIVIFPNPVSSQLRIVSKRDYIQYVTILNLYGQKIKGMTVGGLDNTLDLSVLPSGVYLLRIDLDRGGVNRIFLKR